MQARDQAVAILERMSYGKDGYFWGYDTQTVRILQGMQDPDVPWGHALALTASLTTPDLVLHLIKDGDHRLSRDTDIALLIDTLQRRLARSQLQPEGPPPRAGNGPDSRRGAGSQPAGL